MRRRSTGSAVPEAAATSPGRDFLADSKALVRRFFAAWTEGRFDRMSELLDPAGTWWTLAARRTRTVGAQLERHQSAWAEARDGIRFRVVTLTAEADRVAAVVESWAEFKVQGPYNNLYHFLFRIAGEHIAETWVYYDTALANRVLRGEGGGVPVPGHAAD
jgi:ketosteroid isomerase-like protein